MSKPNKKKKVVVTTNKKKSKAPEQKRRRKASSSRGRSDKPHMELIFGRQNYILMAAGFGLIVLGMLLMAGGGMPDPNVWEPDRIYSFTRITLAPLLILAGLVVEIVAIFKRPQPESETESE